MSSPRAMALNAGVTLIQLRDYPMPLAVWQRMAVKGTLAYAEARAGGPDIEVRYT